MPFRECGGRIGGRLLLGCACAVPAMLAQAAWDFLPEVTLEAEANDNPALNDGLATFGAVDDASRLLADARLRLRRVEPRGELMFEPRVRGDAYAEQEAQQLESTDVFLRSNGIHRGANVRIGYAADIARERILGVEFLETLPVDVDPLIGDPADVPTGQLGANERRTRAAVSPYVEVTLNSRSALRLDGRLLDVDYDGNVLAGRTDFFEKAIGGEYQRRFDERATFGIRLFVTGYEATANSNVTDTRGIALSYGRELSEIWSWSISGGVQRADFALTTGGRRIRGSDDAGTFSLGVRKTGEVSGMRAELARRMSPDALGVVVARNELRLAWDRRFSSRLDGRFVLRAIETDSVSAISANERRYGRAELDIGWRLRGPWSFVAGLAHATARSEGQLATAESNAVTFGVRYRGRPSELSPDPR
jgi:hypothetical protein